jgi:excisionase family DNA binding protein
MGLLTTNEVAEALGITARRVRALIEAKQLPAEKKGRDYLISETSLAALSNRTPGRPRKAAAKKNTTASKSANKKRPS